MKKNRKPNPTRETKSTKTEPAEARESQLAEIIELAPLTLKLRSILVPVDFSPPAQKAIHYALSFADQFGAKLVLLYVVEPAVYPTEFGYVPAEIDNLYRTMDESAREKLASLAEKQVPTNLRAQTLVRLGQPHREICEAAKELGVDLIVIATHGYTGLRHTFLGSTAEKVVRHAPCPVLVVREREHDFV